MHKLEPPEYPHLVADEAFFLEAAQRSGLEAADAEIVRDAEGTDVGRGDLIALGDRVGVRAPAVERALDELRERADLWVDELGSLPFDEGVQRKLRRAIESRRERLGGR